MIRAVRSPAIFPAGLTLLVACAAGCGSNGANGSDGGGTFVTCDTETRAAPYQPGMQVTSNDGTFVLKLLDSQPGPPVKGQNIWTVEVDEAATGLSLAGLDITVTPFMPDHMHGTRPVVVAPTVTETGANAYALTPVYLFMSGVWEVRFMVVGTAVAGGVAETAMIPICIP